MRGVPIRQWLVFLAVWVALAYPISRVTGRLAKPVAADRDVTREPPTWVTLDFSSPPASFELLQGGHVLWSQPNATGMTFESTVPLHLDHDGAALTLTAKLPAGRHAVEVRLEPDAREPRAHTIWAEGPIDEWLEFHWSPDE